MPAEIVLNFGYIYNENGEEVGEKNFVVSAKWLFENIGKICPNVSLETEEDVEVFLDWYDPEVDGFAIFEKALCDNALVVNAFVTWYD